jgi:hypothetical protein
MLTIGRSVIAFGNLQAWHKSPLMASFLKDSKLLKSRELHTHIAQTNASA